MWEASTGIRQRIERYIKGWDTYTKLSRYIMDKIGDDPPNTLLEHAVMEIWEYRDHQGCTRSWR